MTCPFATGPADPGVPPDRADVVVVGGGLPGLTAALTLAEAGTEVLVLEAGPHLGAGVSGLAPGLAVHGVTEHAWRTEAALGTADARALFDWSARGIRLLAARVALHEVPPVWTTTETTREPAELARSREALARLGVEAALIDADEVARTTGGEGFGPGLVVQDDRSFDPGSAVAALADRLRAAGGAVRTGATVGRATPEGDGIVLPVGPHRVACEAIVWAHEAGLAGRPGLLGEAITPVREAAIQFAHAPTSLARAARAGFGWTTCARGPDDTLIVAGCRWATPHLEVGETTAVVAEAVQERLLATAERFFPGHGDVLAAWAWITAHGCDGLPVVGPIPGDPRQVVCAGFAGHEASLGVASGEAVARGLLSGRADVPARLGVERLLG